MEEIEGLPMSGLRRSVRPSDLKRYDVGIVGIAASYNQKMAKALKVMVSFPDDLLERIDREASERGTTRSGFLQEAARRELGWPDPAAIDAALARGRAALDGLGSFESADLIRAEREGRDERDRRR
jgi:HicB_like antitoxin of bacterial toxin-antitoxin system